MNRALMSILILSCSIPLGETYPQESAADSTSSQAGFGISVMRFTGSEMQKAYGYCWDFSGHTFLWVGSSGGALVSIGSTGGSGVPETSGSEWIVKSSALEFWALRFSIAGLYRPFGSLPEKEITPFVGVGLFALGGGEKFSATVLRQAPTIYYEAGAKAWAIRGSVGLFPLVGMSIPVAEQYAVYLLGMFYWGTGSGFTDLASEEITKVLEEKIYPGVHRPDFRFTGLAVYLGVSF